MDPRSIIPAPLATFVRKHVLRRPPRLFHLEVHLTDHCNLNCRGCAHFSSIAEPAFTDPAAFDADLARLASLLTFERIHLLGGEPLLHPEVTAFVTSTRAHFPDTELALVTNGTLLMRQPDELWETLHRERCALIVDDYPVPLPKADIDHRAAEHGVELCWTHPRTEFFRLPIDPLGGHDPARSFAACHGYNNCPILRDGRIYPCAYAAYADILQSRFDLPDIAPGEADSISIRDTDDPYAIAEFLMRPVPWCARCDTDALEHLPWQRGAGDADEWLNGTGA